MGKNFVVIVSDSLRAQNLPFYGYDRDTAPFLTNMAENNTYLEDYYSTAPWTIPAHASMFSGKLPSSHGATMESLYFKGENKLEKYFSQKGYETFCVSENGLVSPKFGFGEDFDNLVSFSVRGKVYDEVVSEYNGKVASFFRIMSRSLVERDIRSLKTLASFPLKKLGFYCRGEDYNPSNSDRTMEEVIEAIRRREKDEFFLFLNLMATHFDYTFRDDDKQKFLESIPEHKVNYLTDHGSPENWIEKYRDLDEEDFEIIRSAYDCSIRYTDFLIKSLYEKLPNDTIFVVLGDHGEVIGEHKLGSIPINEHQFGTFHENIKVPFVAFPHKEDFEEGYYDHRDFLNLVKSIHSGEKISSRSSVFAEYYGVKELWKMQNTEISEDLEDLVERKSFSTIGENYKLDLIFEKDRYREELRELQDFSLVDSEKIRENLKKKIPATMSFMIEDMKDQLL